MKFCVLQFFLFFNRRRKSNYLYTHIKIFYQNNFACKNKLTYLFKFITLRNTEKSQSYTELFPLFNSVISL